jgi:hypothetical protein
MSEQEPPKDERRITISFETSRRIEQYESAKFGVYLSGIPANAPQAEIDEMIATAEITFDRITVAINAKAEEEKARYQADRARLEGRSIPPRTQQDPPAGRMNVPNTPDAIRRANDPYQRFR